MASRRSLALIPAAAACCTYTWAMLITPCAMLGSDVSELEPPVRPACSVPPCLGVPAELDVCAADDAFEDDDDDPPHDASSPPAPSATPPLVASSSKVRRDIRLMT
jgi:hypothetical protein